MKTHPWLYMLAVCAGVMTRRTIVQAPSNCCTIRGVVRSVAGAPIPAANVFLLESLDAATTDSAGRFAVHSRGRRYLVYLGMNEFEARLDPQRFLRIHRSHIVNLDHVTAMEPFAAARMQVTMRDGAKIVASRTRSRDLRGLVL